MLHRTALTLAKSLQTSSVHHRHFGHSRLLNGPIRQQSPYSDLAGKVILVTGLGQMGNLANGGNASNTMWGNGAAIARVLACDHGAKVFGCDLTLDAAKYTQGRVQTEGGQCDVMAADVTSKTQIDNLIKACIEKHGRIDALVNKYV